METLSFKCENNLSKYTTSMLFDSGEVIASGDFEHSGRKVEVDLKICGDVSVTYKDEVYHAPSKFPRELIELIKKHPDDWDVYATSGEGNDNENGDIYVGLNNWFEFIYRTPDGSDGVMYEADLSKETPDSVLDDMKDVARHALGIEEFFVENERRNA